jgi:hypothetical protein
MDDDVFLDGFGLSGFRSFGPTIQRVGELGKVNLFIGKNNCRKSNMLRFAQHLAKYADAPEHKNVQLSALDRHIGADQAHEVELAVAIRHAINPQWQEKCSPELWAWFSASLQTVAEHGCIWIPVGGNTWNLRWKDLVSRFRGVADAGKWANIVRCIWGPASNINSLDEHLERLLRVWLEEAKTRQKGRLGQQVRAIRQITSDASSDGEGSGDGLIRKLAERCNPRAGQEHLEAEAITVRDFVREVCDLPDAIIEVPHSCDDIIVRAAGRRLSYEALGTGISEAIIIAADCALKEGQIICMEEPEVHMHPEVQRKLIRFLAEKTRNQYLISTHSGTLVDSEHARVFSVEMVGGESIVRPAISDRSRFELCSALGYRASDLLQTNCVVWVEGPSDRIYLRHWLAAVAPHLIENLHYSFMFFGGALGKHLSLADDETIEEWIYLQKINRNTALVVDSDLSETRGDLKPWVSRWKQEMAGGSGLLWITAGKEIENYLTASTLRSAFRRVHPRSRETPGRITKRTNVFKGQRNVDKIRIALEVSGRDGCQLDRFDLDERTRALATFIEQANSGQPSG